MQNNKNTLFVLRHFYVEYKKADLIFSEPEHCFYPPKKKHILKIFYLYIIL